MLSSVRVSRTITPISKRFSQRSGKYHRNALTHSLKDRIKAGGPMTVAEYMRECLINPKFGYYMHQDPISEKGDFITSPELSQMFGELVGIWILNEWSKLGAPKPFHIIELGPGRGTLIADILKVLRQFNATDGLSLYLVEVSQYLSKLQAQALKCLPADILTLQKERTEYQSAVTTDGINVNWYSHILYVPKGFSCVIAHEFFDALPIHKFIRTKHGWRELLIDIDFDTDKLKFVISGSVTPAAQVYIKPGEKRNHVEVSPSAGFLVEDIAARLEENGGFALIGDYGHSGDKTDTLRAFRNHKLHDILVEPGSADLTADVDFEYLRSFAEPKSVMFGPVTQSFYLRNMGIDLRLKVLLSRSNSEKRKIIQESYKMMVDDNYMGQRFKFVCMFPAILQAHLNKFPVAGFTDIPTYK